MSHIDQYKLIKILNESPAWGHLECLPWEPGHYINMDGVSHHYTFFEQVSPTLYIDQLIIDTVQEVDEIIKRMMEQ